MSKKPDWLPKKPNNLSAKQWAWQFLRRNPQYQAEHCRWRKLVDGLEGENPQLPEPEQDLRFFICDPPAEKNETYDEYLRRVGNRERGIKPLVKKIGEDYGLKPNPRVNYLLPDPSEDRPHLWFEGAGFRGFVGIPGLRNRRVGGPKDFEVLVRFNLEWPLRPQVEKVEKFLERQRQIYRKHENFREIKNRLNKNLYFRYLRLLDLEACGAKISEMAAEIFPNEENVYSSGYRGNAKVGDSLRAAKKIRDEDYRILPLLNTG